MGRVFRAIGMVRSILAIVRGDLKALWLVAGIVASILLWLARAAGRVLKSGLVVTAVVAVVLIALDRPAAALGDGPAIVAALQAAQKFITDKLTNSIENLGNNLLSGFEKFFDLGSEQVSASVEQNTAQARALADATNQEQWRKERMAQQFAVLTRHAISANQCYSATASASIGATESISATMRSSLARADAARSNGGAGTAAADSYAAGATETAKNVTAAVDAICGSSGSGSREAQLNGACTALGHSPIDIQTLKDVGTLDQPRLDLARQVNLLLIDPFPPPAADPKTENSIQATERNSRNARMSLARQPFSDEAASKTPAAMGSGTLPASGNWARNALAGVPGSGKIPDNLSWWDMMRTVMTYRFNNFQVAAAAQQNGPAQNLQDIQQQLSAISYMDWQRYQLEVTQNQLLGTILAILTHTTSGAGSQADTVATRARQSTTASGG